MKNFFIGLIFIAFPFFALANTTTAIENSVITTEAVVVVAPSDVFDTTAEVQTIDCEDWICFYYWELELIVWEVDDSIIIEWYYFEEWWCYFW